MTRRIAAVALLIIPAALLQECNPYAVRLFAADPPSAAGQPHVLATRWYAYSVTVWSDGNTEINPTTELTPERAEAVAGKVGVDLAVEKAKLTHQVEQLRVEVRRLNTQIAVAEAKLPARPDAPVLPPASASTPLDDGRCKEIAKPGVRCKRVSVHGTGYCALHLAMRYEQLSEIERNRLAAQKGP